MSVVFADRAARTRAARLPLRERFWLFVEKTNDCWNWLSSLSKSRYGTITHEGRTWRAHRLSWVLTYGEIPVGKWVLHKCDNRRCVRPTHLFLGTHQDNVDDMVAKDRHIKGVQIFTAKMTPDLIHQLRSEYTPYVTPARALAEKYGLTERHVWNILKDRNWVGL